jgi:methyl-accepting chemotaxis protein
VEGVLNVVTRTEANAILKDFIESNPTYQGVYVVFEPNAFDGKDAEFIGQSDHDNTGRFIPYWSLDEQGKGVLEPSLDYNEEGKGNYYLIPKKTKKETITDPYLYAVRGKEVLVTSLTVPILDEKKNFLGIAGIDIELSKIQALVRNLKLTEYTNAYAVFYAPDGSVVSNVDDSLTGKNVKDLYSSDPQFISVILNNESVAMDRYSVVLKEPVMSFVANLEVGNTGRSWAVVSNVPRKDIDAPIRRLILQIIGIGGIAILAIVVIVYWIVRQISKAFRNIVEVSQQISVGQLDNIITVTTQDETGQLLLAFQVMQTQLKERVENDKRIVAEISAVVSMASQGNFNQRVNLEDKIDVFKAISESINRVLEFNQLAIRDLTRVFSAVSQGDLTQTITNEYAGELAQLKRDANVTVQQLTGVTEEIKLVTGSASQGDFSKRVVVEGKMGTFKTISESINRVLEFNQLAIRDLTRVFSAVSQGDLTQTIANEYVGELAQLKRDANITVQQLTGVTEEIKLVTGSASQGDFSKRVAVEGKIGTFKTISESINRVLEFNQSAIKDLTRVFSAVSQGDLTQTITNEYSGELAQLKKDANITVQRLTNVTEEISTVTHTASEGDFSKRVNLENKTGTFKIIGESINQVLNFNQLAIKDLMHVFSAVAQGDLTKTITNEYAGELAQLKQDANATVQKLTEIIRIIRTSAEIVSDTTAEISQGNSSLSQRTTEQAASLEETSSSMEQMTTTVQQNADNAKQASQLAIGAKERAEHGNEVVNCTILAIKEISESSKKINEIITVIDDIAFQTNLLALNAAVEAARAGEHGRGFTVVASEVRNLAQRSASAAKEIKTLIQDSGAKVDEGSRLANQSGQTLADIVISVKKVSDIVAEISAASTEQSSGIEQVDKAISQMDEVVEQNSALVEELAAASESMKDQAQELQKQVTFFKIGKGTEFVSSSSSKNKLKPTGFSSRKLPKNTDNDDDWKNF